MNGKIYKIIDNTNNNIYVGSTCEPTLLKRLNKHKSDYKRYISNGSRYTTSYDILKNNDYNIELLEEVEFNNKYELHVRERHWITNIDCINKYKPNNYLDKGKHEYQKEYKEKHRLIHGIKICECGGKYMFSHKSHHIKTKRHNNYLLTLEENNIT
jgi:hypothetical protein